MRVPATWKLQTGAPAAMNYFHLLDLEFSLKGSIFFSVVLELV